MMERLLWASAALVVLVQTARLVQPAGPVGVGLTVLPLAGMLLFLVGLGLSARDEAAPPALVTAAAAGGTAVALFAAPFRFPRPSLDLAASLLGAVCLIAVAAWISVRHRLEGSPSSLLVALGGVAGVVAFCRAALRRHLASLPTEGAAPSHAYHALETAAGFGLGALLLLTAVFLHRRHRRAPLR